VGKTVWKMRAGLNKVVTLVVSLGENPINYS